MIPAIVQNPRKRKTKKRAKRKVIKKAVRKNPIPKRHVQKSPAWVEEMIKAIEKHGKVLVEFTARDIPTLMRL